MKRKTVELFCVGYQFEIGHHVYPIKVYEAAVEGELCSATDVFRTEEEAQREADKRQEAMDQGGK